MRVFWPIILCGEILVLAGGAAAQSLYRVSYPVDGAIIGATALANAAPYGFGAALIKNRCPCDPSQVNPLDRSVIGNDSALADDMSDFTVGLAAAAPVVLDLYDQGATRSFAEDIIVYGEALSVNGALVTLAKYTVQRPLPIVYAGKAPKLINNPRGYRSFYSGHVSTAFAALSVAAITLDSRYDAGAWPWIIVGGVGTSVAVEGVLAGRHFYTDVAMGMVAGSFVGTFVPLLHSREYFVQDLSLRPLPGGLALAWKRRF